MNHSFFASFSKLPNAVCRVVLLLLLLIVCSKVDAQTVKAVINPTGGTPAGNDLKIEVLSDGGIKVTRKGLLESYIRTDSSQGMRAHFDFKNSNYIAGPNLKGPAVCYVSPVSGTGNYWDPYKVHIVGTILDKYKNYPTGQTGTVTIILSYVKNTNYFFMDYVLHMPQVSGFTKALLYQSEQVVMGMANGDDPDGASPCAYGFISPDGTTVGVFRDASCAMTPESPRSHVYRALRPFDSWEVSNPANRFNINDAGKFPNNTIADGVDGTGRSMAIMKQLGAIFRDGTLDPDPMNFKTYRLLSGYGTSMTEFDSIKAMKDTIPVPGFAAASIKFSNGTLSGNEGNTADGEQPAQGLTLTVSGGKLNAPAYVLVKYDAAYASNYSHPAIPGTDFTLGQEAFLVPAGDYTTPKTVTIPNLHVIGNDQLQYSRTLRLKLVSTCTSLLSISGTSEVDYTIVDDEPRTLTLNMDSVAMYEGNTSKARITMPIGITCPEDIVISFSRIGSSTAGDSDYVVPATVVIPANQTGTAVFNISAKADKTLENTENVSLKFQGTILGIGVTSQKDFQIKDSTFLNPNYSQIQADCISPNAARPVPEGYNGFLGLHLPPGVSTEVTITINDLYVDWDNSTAEDQEDFDLNYYSGLEFKITPGTTVTKVPFTVFADAKMEGSTPEYFNLTMIPVDDVGAGRLYNYVGPAVTIKDMDSDPSLKLVLTATPSTIKEGNTTGAAVTVALPNGIIAASDISVGISRGLSSKATDADLVSLLPTNVVIKAGKNSVSFPVNVKAAIDNLLEGDESLWIVTTPVGYTVDSSLITIQDATGDAPGMKDMKIELVTPDVKEGTNTGIKISFVNTTVTAQDPISITLSHDASSAAATTDYGIPATITLPAGLNTYTVPAGFTAVSDMILEADEAVKVNGVATTIPGLTVTGFSGVVKDATGDDPNNKKITVTSSHAQMDEGGTGYSITYSLPAGVTTELPIQITPELAVGSTASPADYTLAATPLFLNGGNSVSTGINILEDVIVEGDEIMVMGGTTTSMITGLQLTPATVIIKDKTKIAGPAVTADRTDLIEGGAGAFITITMPSGTIPSAPLTVKLTRGASSEAVSGFTGIPQTVMLSGNSITIPVPVSATSDNILGDNEKLIVVVETEGYPKDSIAFNIIDVTINNPANTKITFTPQPASQGNRVMEGSVFTARASLPPGVTTAKPVLLQVQAKAASVATSAVDYTGLPTTFTINPGTGYADFSITALSDKVIENAELLRFTGSAMMMPQLVVDSFDLFIDDATITDPAAGGLKLVYDSTAITKGGGATKVTIGFVDPLVTSETPITINVTPDPSSTADITNYTGLPSVVTIPAGQNSVTYYLRVGNNFKLEGTTILQFAAQAPGMTFQPIAGLNILEIAGEALSVEKIADAAEPAQDGMFRIKLPVISTSDVTVMFRCIYNATNVETPPVGVVIPAGSNEIYVTVKIKDDQILQGDQVMKVTLISAVAANNGSPINLTVDITPALINVIDDENATTGPKATARQLLIEKLSDALQPSTSGYFRIRFYDSTLVAADNIKVVYGLAGTATQGTDYNIMPGYAIIPKGKSMVNVEVSPAGIRYAGPDLTVQSTLTEVSSGLPDVNWNFVPNPSATLTIYNRNVDTPVVNLFAATSQITEGDEVEFVLRLSRAITVDLPVTVDVTNDVYRTLTLSGGVITNKTILVTVPKGAREKSFKVKVNDNELSDDDGFIKAAIREYNPVWATAPYYTGLASEILNTVGDNDSLKLSYTENQYAVKVDFDTLGVPLKFKVRMNRPSSRIVTVYYEFYTPAPTEIPANTMAAVPVKDYDNQVLPILILEGQTEVDIPVLVNSVEKDKIFGMRVLRGTVSSNQHAPVIDPIVAASGLIKICMDCDVDGDGVPDYIERFVTDGRWKDNNKGEVRVHPAMSPNNDGLGNEVMQIENIDKYAENEVTVFNRWGGAVFTTKNYNNQTNNFNGKGNTAGAKGQDVPDGSYFYIIHTTDAQGNKKRHTGFIVIKR